MLSIETQEHRKENLELETYDDPGEMRSLTRLDIIQSYRVAEFATLTRDGSPVCWPLAPDFQRGRLIFSTGYTYPTKAINARRNPRVAALFSDPTASGRPEGDPQLLVQGLAEVFDQDLQRNTERYVDQLLEKGPLPFRLILRTPGLRQLMVGYLARIWIEVTPQNEFVCHPGQFPTGHLQIAIRPATFTPGPGIQLPQELLTWLPRYQRQPVLAYIDRYGWPAMTRVQVTVRSDHIVIDSQVKPSEGAPVCLTYHRLIGNYQANDTFLIRGHFDTAGKLIPEKVVGFGGTKDDRGLGSPKMLPFLMYLRRKLLQQLRKENRPIPVVRPTPEK